MSSTLTNAVELAPKVAARSGQIEQERRIPADLLDALAAAGCFRMLSPRRHGGDELPLPAVVRVVNVLARADAAVGWTVGQHCSAQLLFEGFPAGTVAQIYAAGPDVLGAGAVAPKGRARLADSGWQVSGRWPFVTGCQWSSWIYANCVATDGGVPHVRLFLFPAEDVQIVDTWRAAGLCGTGSHDVVIQGHCPAERSSALPGDTGTAVTEHPQLLHGSFFLAAVSLGIAQRALDDLLSLLSCDRRAPRAGLPAGALGAAHMSLRAAEALLSEQAGQAALGTSSPISRARALATAASVTGTAKHVVSDLFGVAGSAAVYETCPLQRHLRDIHVAAQHFLNRPHTLDGLGTALLATAEPVSE